ncbi:MAG: hypothetical protein Kow00128_16470 [Deltaproteobacteria bacterium]
MTRPPASEFGLLRVEVRVTWREAPLPGAQVEWFTGIGDPIRAPAAIQMSGEDGIASCTLPPGRYFLYARWRRDGDYSRPNAPGDRFAYFGGNPVYLHAGSAGRIHLGLESVYPAPSPPPGEPEGTGVGGMVRGADGPVEGAHVFAYTRTASGFRDLGFAASPPTDGQGTFRIDLPPGVYYLVARKRASGGLAGPLRKGDFFGFFPDNPVTVERGRLTLVTIPATRLKLRNLPVYSRNYAAAASIEGRILDPQGNPRRGVYAALYDNPDLLNRPLFLSEVTGADGTFRLPVPLPGRYYLGARSGYGGSPAPGDLYGRYEGAPDHAIVVRQGDRLTGIDIVVREVW